MVGSGRLLVAGQTFTGPWAMGAIFGYSRKTVTFQRVRKVKTKFQRLEAIKTQGWLDGLSWGRRLDVFSVKFSKFNKV